MVGFRVLAGYWPDERGDDALALAKTAGRTAGRTARLTVANVHTPAWPARGPGSVDAEWLAYLRGQARAALDQAADRLAGVKDVDYVIDAHRGSGRGLIHVARQAGADVIVIGSAPRGRPGRIAIGSTADQLLHGSPVPVLLAPRGYAQDAPRRFTRLTIAYWRRRGSDSALLAAADVARSLGLPVRLLTLVLRPPALTAKFRDADEVLRRQCDQAERDLAHAAALLGSGTGTEVALGSGVPAALGSVSWPAGEVLGCMSSVSGPLRKVFLGDTSGKIVRAAPCPVLVLPRGPANRPGIR